MTDQPTLNWRVAIKTYAPLLLWISVIFLLSSPEASFSKTSRIIGPLIDLFFPNMPEATKVLVHGYVRKAAHFTEYAALALLAVRAFSTSAVYLVKKWRFVLALALVAIVASLDEFNQSFEISRTGSIWDVALDLSGGLAMVAVLWAINRPRLDPPLEQ